MSLPIPRQQTGPGTPRWNDPRRVLLAAALGLTFLAYARTLGYGFVYDDITQIVRNPLVQSWQHLPNMFSGRALIQFQSGGAGDYYRPLYLLWLLLNHTLFGLNPGGWHFTTVALHLVATASVYFLAERLTQNRVTAGFAALIFGLHPLHVEATAYVAGVTEPLLAVLFLPAFLYYLKAREPGGSALRNRAIALVLFALALLAKETALMMLALVVLHAWIFEGETSTRAVRLRSALRVVLSYAGVAAVYFAIRLVILSGSPRPHGAVSFATFLFTLPSLAWFYFWKLLLPVGLSGFYDAPYVTGPQFRGFLLPLAALLAVGGVTVYFARRSRCAAFVSLWLWLLLLPPLAGILVFEQADIVHDRYTYLPSAGFALLAALALRGLRAGAARRFPSPDGRPLAATALASAVILLLGAGTVTQSAYWKDPVMLYTRAVEVAPRSVLARSLLATEMLRSGRTEDAIRMYQQALALDPHAWRTNFILGHTFLTTGRLAEAVQYFRRAIEIDPRNANQYHFLGLTLLAQNRLPEAEEALRRALERMPDAPEIHYALGTVLEKRGDIPGALAEFRAELAVNPQHAQAQQQVAELETRLSGAVRGQKPARPAPRP